MSTDIKMHSALIKALHIEALDEVKQIEMIESMGAIIYQGAIMKALDTINGDQLTEFEKLTDKNPAPDQIFAFFREKIPNFDDLIQEEATQFIADGDNIMSQIGN